MGRLADVPIEELETALDDATGKKETMRLLTAMIYKRGPSVPMIAEWLDVREATIYGWFDRLEDEPIDAAVRDRERPGRPPKLTEEQRTALRKAVRRPPEASGYSEATWTVALAQQYLEERFGVEYSGRHVRRLLGAVDSAE
jgi:transposase